MTLRLARQVVGILAFGLTAALARPARACDVPVFRYALENWPASPYVVEVLHRGPLPTGDLGALQQTGGASSANVTVRSVDLAEASSARQQRQWRGLGSPALPLLVLRSPHASPSGPPLWSGPLTASNVTKLVDSPARREIVRRLLDGDSAVWVLLESGDRTRDAAVRARLESTLQELQRTLKLPVVQGAAPLSRDDSTRPPRPPLQLRFSLLALSRRDAEESVFVALLMNSEKGLGRYASEPIVFPIYGRGRALYALVGKGITDENVREAGAFLIGSCSCEAKALNPGTDLLMTADWDGRLVDSAVQAAGSQPLVGLATLSQAARPATPVRRPQAKASAANAGPRMPTPAHQSPPPAPKAHSDAEAATPAAVESPRAPRGPDAPPPAPSGELLRNMLVALSAVVAISVLLGALAMRRRTEARP
jgi:hypothetical protein